MLKNIIKAIAMILFLSSLITIYQLRENNFKRTVAKEIMLKSDTKYNISENIKRVVNNRENSFDQEKIPDAYKFIYEINFSCSRCLMDLEEIYSFYIKLSSFQKIEFCLVTAEKSYSFMKFHLDQSLKKYCLWIIQQKAKNIGIKNYLVDKSNNIIMAGDIIKYPFLKIEYINKIQNR